MLLPYFLPINPISTQKKLQHLREEHLPRVLNHLLDADEEGDGFAAVEDAVVVGQGEVHHGADLDLAVDGDGLVLDSVQAEDGGLGQVDDGSAHEGTKDAAVGDGEGAAGHVFNGELVVTGLGVNC
jgi:hypothetical protein